MNTITITISDQAAVAALNSMSATLPINQTKLYQEVFDAVRRAEDARNERALDEAIARREAAKQPKE